MRTWWRVCVIYILPKKGGPEYQRYRLIHSLKSVISLANRMATVLKAKGYHYQYVLAINAEHVDRAVKNQTRPEALEWVWQGCPVNRDATPAAIKDQRSH